MRRTGRRLLVLLGIFLLAAFVFILVRFYLRNRSQDTRNMAVTSQEEVGESLPVVAGQLHGIRVNPLPGYTCEVDMAAMEDSLMLIGSDGRLPLSVMSGGDTVAAIFWEIRTRDNSRKVADGAVENWGSDKSTFDFTLELRDVVAANGREYRLILTLATLSGTEAKYYTRVRREDDLHAAEMMQFVEHFHEAVFDRQTAEECAVYLEPDQTADNSTFADVNIHSSYSNLTYGKLSPTQLGETNFRILEMDSSFGSFYLEYLVMIRTESDIASYYICSEYFSIQWSTTRFYLMDYHRTMTELLHSDGEKLSEGELRLGIQRPEDVQVLQSEDRELTVFTAGGELWSYRSSSQMLTKVFSFRSEEEPDAFAWNNYQIKALKAESNGDVSFLVYGYMNRGRHEGQLGISCMTYCSENNSLTEKFFLPYTGTWETLAKDLERLACMSDNGDVFLMAGDSLYSIDWEGAEIVLLADRVSDRNLAVNEEQTAVAWEISGESGESGSVQILYLDTGESQIAGADPGDWISPRGFIGEDCVLGIGHIGDAAVSGAVTVKPFYALEIRDRTGNIEAHYEKKNIYISSVTVAGNQVRLQRLKKKNNALTAAKDDTLIENTADYSVRKGLLRGRNENRLLTVQWLTVDPEGKASGEVTQRSPESVIYSMGDGTPLGGADQEDMCYYAFAEGHLTAVTETAGEAIAQVYTRMGAVTDRRGRLVWCRTGRQQSVSLKSSADNIVENASGLRQCLRRILAVQNLDVSALQDVKDGMSAMDAMEVLFPGAAVNLTGSPMRSLLYYLDRQAPVILIDRSQKVLLLTGYDTYNVEYYDPAAGGNIRQGQKDAAEWLENNNISAIGFLSEY